MRRTETSNDHGLEVLGLTNKNREIRVINLDICVLILDKSSDTSTVLRSVAEQETKLLATLSDKITPDTHDDL